mgnify:CR=1 FL=1
MLRIVTMGTPDLTTLDHTIDDRSLSGDGSVPLAVTLLWHPDPKRIGYRAQVLLGRTPLHISRSEPLFPDERPLDDPRISRSPLQLVPQPGGGLQLWPSGPSVRFTIDGEAGQGGEQVALEDLQRGVVLGLGRGALLLLQLGEAATASRNFGLVGASVALSRIAQRIDTLAQRPEPLLITGPSGTGKELVARAVHRAGPRADKPFVAVNLAALAPGTAPSQLFGHERGAFTGAGRAHQGFFVEADGGTLLLDEVGACPPEVQSQLLRALESSEIQPVGGAVRKVDVRVLAATDSVIEDRLCEDDFRAPLYFRLARSKLHIPPLRRRPADIAVQLVHFLRIALHGFGAGERLRPAPPHAAPWLSRDVMEAVLAHGWPGNTRELISVAGELAERFGSEPVCGLPHFIRIGPRVPGPRPESTLAQRPAPCESSPVEGVLRAHGYQLGPSARALGIGVATLRRRMAALDLPRAQELGPDQIRAALDKHPDSNSAAVHLRVSAHGLKLRMKELGLGDD